MANADANVIRGDSSQTSVNEPGKQFFNRMIQIEEGVAIILMDVRVRQINTAVCTATSDACGWTGALISLSKPQNSKIRDKKLYVVTRPTDGRTDRQSVS